MSTSSRCVRSPLTNSGSPPAPRGARNRCDGPVPLKDRKRIGVRPTHHLKTTSWTILFIYFRVVFFKCTNMTCPEWARWDESSLRGRMPTGFLSASAPLPHCLALPLVLETRRAGCWSGRNGRRGCLRCPCQCLPHLHRMETSERGKKERCVVYRVWLKRK